MRAFESEMADLYANPVWDKDRHDAGFSTATSKAEKENLVAVAALAILGDATRAILLQLDPGMEKKIEFFVESTHTYESVPNVCRRESEPNNQEGTRLCTRTVNQLVRLAIRFVFNDQHARLLAESRNFESADAMLAYAHKLADAQPACDELLHFGSYKDCLVKARSRDTLNTVEECVAYANWVKETHAAVKHKVLMHCVSNMCKGMCKQTSISIFNIRGPISEDILLEKVGTTTLDVITHAINAEGLLLFSNSVSQSSFELAVANTPRKKARRGVEFKDKLDLYDGVVPESVKNSIWVRSSVEEADAAIAQNNLAGEHRAAQLTSEVAAKDALLAEKDTQLAEKNAEIERLKARICSVDDLF